MILNPKLTLRKVCDESILLMSGNKPGATSKLVALNEASCYLWDALKGREFSQGDVVNLLLAEYEVEPSVAQADAQRWLEEMKKEGVVI